MQIFGNETFVYMIKVFSQKKYRDDFIKGHMYLNESGYFNKLEDNYRGDKYDSQAVEFNATIYINGIEFHPDSLSTGFVGDDKIPILCMTRICEESIEKVEGNKFKLKESVIKELSQFGECALLFMYGELHNNLQEFAIKNEWRLDQDVVKYVDMQKDKEYLSLYKGDRFNKYFIKNISYKEQNEARIILLSKDKYTPIISKDSHHIEFDITPLKCFYEFNISENIEFEIKKNDNK